MIWYIHTYLHSNTYYILTRQCTHTVKTQIYWKEQMKNTRCQNYTILCTFNKQYLSEIWHSTLSDASISDSTVLKCTVWGALNIIDGIKEDQSVVGLRCLPNIPYLIGITEITIVSKISGFHLNPTKVSNIEMVRAHRFQFWFWFWSSVVAHN